MSFDAFNPSDYGSEAEAEADDVANNVRTIVLDIAQDGVDEGLEGYKFTLSDASGAAILGTKEVTGTAKDGSDSGVAMTDSIWLGTTDGDYNNDANWNNGQPDGTATFNNTATTTSLSFSADTTVGGWSFAASAGNFDFTTVENVEFTGAGIEVSDAGSTVDITINSDGIAPFFEGISFLNSSSASVETAAGHADITNNQHLRFEDSSTAGKATITNGADGTFQFLDDSTAGSASITNGGALFFNNDSSAGTSDIINNGSVEFLGASTAGTAGITNNASVNFGSADSSADNAVAPTISFCSPSPTAGCKWEMLLGLR